MEGGTAIGRRMTLSDQLSVVHDDKNNASSVRGRTLRDVIREDEDDSGIRSAASSGTVRVSLMTLMGMREREEEDAVGIISCNSGDVEEEITNRKHVCCVCMEREKGAAFIPCGHTFCRVCSRELLLGRGNCPLCNASILDLLHIF